MADYPALPLWTDAYLADTRHLTTVQHGAYLLLLIEAWRRPCCSLPDNDELLAKLASMPLDDWLKMKPAIMTFWHLNLRDRQWTQKRLSREKCYVRKVRSARRDVAISAWKKRKKHDANAFQCDENASHSELQTLPEHYRNMVVSPSSSKQTKKRYANVPTPPMEANITKPVDNLHRIENKQNLGMQMQVPTPTPLYIKSFLISNGGKAGDAQPLVSVSDMARLIDETANALGRKPRKGNGTVPNQPKVSWVRCQDGTFRRREGDEDA